MSKLKILWLVLIAKSFLMASLILFGPIGLGPDEAQYWSWSQNLDYGYYSKPGAIAWVIYLSTQIFGQTEFAVRLPSLLMGFFLPLALFKLAKSAKLNEDISYKAALFMAFTPFGFLAAFLAITDVGMVLFFSLALIPFAASLKEKKAPNYALAGLFIALGAQFKWAIYFFALPTLLYFFLFKNFRTYKVFIGVFISLIGFFPSYLWNRQNDFQTLKHVSTQMSNIGDGRFSFLGNWLAFFGAETALLSPVFFILLGVSAYFLIKNGLQKKQEIAFFLIPSYLFIFFLILSPFKKMQGNWIDWLYPFFAVVIAIGVDKLQAKKFFTVAISSSIALTLFVFSIPSLQNAGYFSSSLSVNPFRHNVGLQHIGDALAKFGYNAREHFLFSSKYQAASQLNFYAAEKKRPYFLNLDGERHNQFSLWPSLKEERLGQDGYFIVLDTEKDSAKIENTLKTKEKELKDYFKKVIYMGSETLFFCNGKSLKRLHIFSCIGYNGQEPKNFDKY